MILRARQFTFHFPGPALVMGIVNVTPDSFSDGGQFLDPDAAVAHALELVEQGAGILDVGGESTRPGAVPVAEADELRRVLPVIERLAARVNIPISIDTIKPGVARAALAAGASIVNDVAANRPGDDLWQAVAEAQAAVSRPQPAAGPRQRLGLRQVVARRSAGREIHHLVAVGRAVDGQIRRHVHVPAAEDDVAIDGRLLVRLPLPVAA